MGAAVEQSVEIKGIDTTQGRKRIVTRLLGKTKPDFETKHEKRFTVSEITPDAAKVLLHLIDRQRPLRATTVKSYATAMAEKRWVWTPQSSQIILSKDYHLIDAQHRLNAVVASGVPLKDVTVCVVTDNKSAEAIDVDIQKRSVRDVVKFNTGAGLDARVVSAIMFEASNFLPMTGIYTDKDRIDICSTYDFVTQAQDLSTWGHRMHVRSGVIAAALRCYRIYGDDALVFFSKVFMNDHVINGKFSDSAKRLSDYLIAGMQQGTDVTKVRNKNGHPFQKQNAEVALKLFMRWHNGDAGPFKTPSLKVYADRQTPRDVAIPESMMIPMPAFKAIPKLADRLYTK